MDKELLSIGETARMLGVSIDTLRRWDKSGRLISFRPTPTSKRYYRRTEVESFLPNNLVVLMRQWVTSENPSIPSSAYHCLTRDVFQARLEHMQNELSKIEKWQSIFSVIVAIAGEIGNNSFDHNMGNWPDISGIFFGYDLKRQQIVLADRGQGILKTLQRIRPSLKNDQKAMEVAFTEVISGRQPESRGNGLKFVKEIVISYPLHLIFQTGNAFLELKQRASGLDIKKTSTSFHGCLAIIYF